MGDGLGVAVAVGLEEGEEVAVDVGEGKGVWAGVDVGTMGPLPWHVTNVDCAVELPPLKVAATLTMYIWPEV